MNDQMIGETIPRMVVCAAIQDKVGNIICSPRHWDTIMYVQYPGEKAWEGAKQGFVDQRGVFMTREEAWAVAENAGQIRRRVGGDMSDGVGKLFSGNLY